MKWYKEDLEGLKRKINLIKKKDKKPFEIAYMNSQLSYEDYLTATTNHRKTNQFYIAS